MNPFAMLSGEVTPPAWHGPARLIRKLSDGDEVDEAVDAEVPVATLTCRACRQDLPATSEFFYRSARYRSGFLNLCKACYAQHPCIQARRKVQRAAANESAPIVVEDWQALEELQRRAAKAVLLVCPAWTLISPGSPREALVRQVPAALWWPYPNE